MTILNDIIIYVRGVKKNSVTFYNAILAFVITIMNFCYK